MHPLIQAVTGDPTTTHSGGGTSWTLLSTVLTGLVAFLSLGWAVLKDLRRDKQTSKVEADKVANDYVEHSLSGLRELTAGLQEEVKRLEAERDKAEKSRQDWEARAVQREEDAQRREHELLRQVRMLREEIRGLREVIEEAGVALPPALRAI